MWKHTKKGTHVLLPNEDETMSDETQVSQLKK